jgi:hypothetical protein
MRGGGENRKRSWKRLLINPRSEEGDNDDEEEMIYLSFHLLETFKSEGRICWEQYIKYNIIVITAAQKKSSTWRKKNKIYIYIFMYIYI